MNASNLQTALSAAAGPRPGRHSGCSPGPLILCADDYGLAAGVSRGILELAQAGKISATSAMVTFPRWAEDAGRLAAIRSQASIGLHINLTLGAPAGPMPKLAPQGVLPAIGSLVQRALLGQFQPEDVQAEIQAEVTRQLVLFEQATGFAPDHVDGHQHAHALPGVRDAVLAALSARFGSQDKPLVRNPADKLVAILQRGGERFKALSIAALSQGFAAAANAHGFPVNRGFSGFSAFDPARPYALEIATALLRTGPCHIVMCHPGYPDSELRGLDPVVERRGQELTVIASGPPVVGLWRVDRRPDGPPVDWQSMLAHAR